MKYCRVSARRHADISVPAGDADIGDGRKCAIGAELKQAEMPKIPVNPFFNGYTIIVILKKKGDFDGKI